MLMYDSEIAVTAHWHSLFFAIQNLERVEQIDNKLYGGDEN